MSTHLDVVGAEVSLKILLIVAVVVNWFTIMRDNNNRCIIQLRHPPTQLGDG